ncbi:MAG: DUF6133 family protein [Aristaeellaceae bacterium]
MPNPADRRRMLRDESGEAYLDMAMKILITVVVGAAILAIMRDAIPQLFADLIGRVSAEIDRITILV